MNMAALSRGPAPGSIASLACRLAWAGSVIAFIAAVGALAAGFGSRFGLWHFRTGFSILRWSASIGLMSLPAALAALVLSVKNREWRCFGMGTFALVVGAVVFLVPLSWRMTARKVPPIHDITTDFSRPPQFVAVLPLRKNAPNPAEYGGEGVADQQRAGYPDIRTAIIDLPADQVFRKALQAARGLGWKVVAEVPAEGRIEATDTTFWFGFTDDIVLRITPAGYRSLVDLRSVSRVGKSDVGTNAARIRKFLNTLQSR